MELIEHIEVGSGGAASIVFSAISQDYTDLYLTVSARINRASTNDDLYVRLNGSTTGYTARRLYGRNTVDSDTVNSQSLLDANSTTANTFGSTHIYIPNYTSSNYKSMSGDGVTENNSGGTGDAYQVISATQWADTSAVTSITLASDADFMEFSSATLYGIRKYDTTGSPKATGGIISYDSVNNYWVHTFTASGTFTPTENLTAEYLVVAGGGGGGGNRHGGGGGAGGYRCSVSGESSGGGASAETPLSLTASTGYTVTIGAGGAGGGSTNTNGSKGSNSVFSTITSEGGGYGAGYTGSGGAGGSGGGGSGNVSSAQSGGSATANQGSNGGAGGVEINYGGPGGGGGGAGQVGQDAPGSFEGGDGGNGLASSITGSSITRAGGGGGGPNNGGVIGTGGAGGGGDATVSGSPNTGGGGGGGNPYATSGGSGIVIVRYAA